MELNNSFKTKFPVSMDPSRLKASVLKDTGHCMRGVSSFSTHFKSPMLDDLFKKQKALLSSSKCETLFPSKKRETSQNIESRPTKKLRTGPTTSAKEAKKPRDKAFEQRVKEMSVEDIRTEMSVEECISDVNYDNVFEKMDVDEEWADDYGKFATSDMNKFGLADGQVEKVMLLRFFNQAMIKMPNFKMKDDSYRGQLLSLLDKCPDPEFVLKVSLYGRKHLNVRTASNFLLAYAAMNESCKPFVAKYYASIIVLPSDWLEVAELALTFCKDGKVVFPTSLRKVMAKKFVDFDKYQLGKYNKDRAAIKRRREKKRLAKPTKPKPPTLMGRGARGRGRGGLRRFGRIANIRTSFNQTARKAPEENKGEEFDVPQFTIKQLIRKLHISQPVDNVMCLIGKKYPSNMEAFFLSRLPGLFEQEKAGKRMKLPTPETWETQVSLKGNTAKVWEELIDHKKLPFMAMLRNLRNLILANISEKHHQLMIGKLTNENSVINSKQFPFRFFSAYSVLDQLGDDDSSPRVVLKKSMLPQKKKKNKSPKPTKQQLQPLLARYKTALDKAVKISTTYNIPPLPGRTVIFCDVGDRETNGRKCSSAKGLGEPRTIGEMTVLLSLMCKHACEESRLLVCGSKKFEEVQLNHKDSILANTKSVLELQHALNDDGRRGYDTDSDDDDDDRDYKYLAEFADDLIYRKEKIDRWIVLGGNSDIPSILSKKLKVYVDHVRWDLKAFNVNLGKTTTESSDTTHEVKENDFIDIFGFSEQVLRYIAEEGDKGQMTFVDNMDKFHHLEDSEHLRKMKRRPLEIPAEVSDDSLSKVQRWSSCRVFISSTFLDMFSERDLLVKYIFQELKVRARSLRVNIFDVDLRWGISEEQTQNNQTIELCLSEVSKCQFFIGMLGDRYGWCPEDYDGLSRCPGLEWVEKHPKGASLTELEFHQCFRSLDDYRSRAFFYFRDPKFLKDVPGKLKHLVVDGNELKLKNLKRYVMSSGAEVYDNYPCHWGGVGEDGKARVINLEEFGKRVLDNLWNAIQKVYSKDGDADDDDDDEMRNIDDRHLSYVDFLESRFVGRQKVIRSIIDTMATKKKGLLLVTGKPGSGKSALMASVFKEWTRSYVEKKKAVIHFVGASPGSDDVIKMVARFVSEMDSRLKPGHVTYDVVCKFFHDVLHNRSVDVGKGGDKPILIFIDGVDQLSDEHQARLMAWLPHNIPEHVMFIVSTNENSESHTALKHRPSLVGTFDLAALTLPEKQDMVRGILKTYSKHLDESAFNNQMKLITSKKESSSPLYLSLVCEEMRLFGDFETVNSKLSSLPPTIPKLLQDIIAKLEKSHGELFTRTALCCLACAKDGLMEYELQELISRALLIQSWAEATLFDDVNGKVVTFDLSISPSSLLFFLREAQSLLSPNSKEGMIMMTSREVLESVRQRYTSTVLGKKYEKFVHMLIASYFYSAVDPNRNVTLNCVDRRTFSSLIHHLVHSCCYDALSKLSTDLMFVQCGFKLGLSKELKEAYLVPAPTNAAQKKDYDAFIGSNRFGGYKKFVFKNSHLLSIYPQSTLQQALSEPDDSHVYRDAEQLLLDRPSCRTPCALWINKHHYQDLCVQTVEAKDASCLALNSDDRILAVGFETAAIKTFSTSSYEVTSTLIGHSGGIMSLCFVSNVRLCSASSDGTLSLWDIVNGFRIAVMEGHSRSVTSCASDKVGRIVVSVGLDAQIKVWHGVTGKPEDFISRDVRPINCLALHPEGKLLVIGSWDSALKIWDYLEKAKKAVLRGHSGSVQEVKFNQSGVHIASIDIFGEVRIWSSQHGCTLGILKNRSFTGVFYSPDFGELLTSSSDGTVKVMSPTLGRCTAALGDSKHGHATCLTFDPFSETFMPDFVVGYHSGSVRMFSSAAGSMMWERIHKGSPTSVSSIAFHRINDLTFLIVGRLDGSCEMFSKSGHDNKTIATLITHDSPVTGVCCYDNVVITSAGKTLNEFRLSDHSKLNPNSPIKPIHSYEEHEGMIMAIAKGRHLASVGRDRTIVVWSTHRSLSVVNKIKDAHKDWITCCSWSSQDDHLVTGSNDCLLKIWDAREGKVKYTLEGHVAMVTGVAYRHGCIVSSGSDGSVKVWSHKGVCVSNLRASNVKCNSCDLFVGIKKEEEISREKENRDSWQIRSMVEEAKNEKSKDSEATVVVVASCYDDGSVKIWNPIEAEERHVLVGHKEEIKAVVAGHRGVVCSVSTDGLLKAWSIPSKVPDGSSAENSSAVSCLDVSRDGVLMCCGTRDGFVRLWLQTEFAAASVACGRAMSSVRVSIKQVTTLCFVSDAMLAVSSDDLQLSIWKVIGGGGGDLGLSFFKSVPIDRPITCMAALNRDNHLVTIQLQGLLRLWNVDKMDVVFERKDSEIASAMDLVFGGGHMMMDDDNDIAFFVFKHESFEKWSYDVVKRKDARSLQLHSKQCMDSTGSMTSFARDGSKLLFFGTTEGLVDVREADDICNERGLSYVHSDEITGMVCDGDVLFTCSRDGFVKAFDTSKSVVIGQILTPFILTSMTRICKGHLGVTKVVCGTESGILIGIQWVVRR